MIVSMIAYEVQAFKWSWLCCEILILRPYRGLHLSLHYDDNIGNGIIFNLDLTRTYILYDGILRI